MSATTREDLDKVLIKTGQRQIGLCCSKHPKVGLDVLYQDGQVRLLCRDCGFECAKIQVASDLTRGLTEHDGEICEDCGGEVDVVWWCHDDALWEKVTGHIKPAGSRESAPGILCIHCFDRKAKEVCPWIEWAPLNLRHLLEPEISEEVAEARHAREKSP